MFNFVPWFHKFASPPAFERFAKRWALRCRILALLALLPALAHALLVLPAEKYMGDSVRILFIHVPCAWMSLSVFVCMATWSAIALAWHIKLAEILAMACAPIGTAFTLLTLLTGSLWGRTTWGTYWDWDPRLTSELILLFL